MRTKLITLIVLFAVVLTSCAPAATPVPAAEPVKPAAVEPTSAPAVVEATKAPTAPVSISFMTPPWGVPPNTEALAAFEKESGIKVEIISLPMDQLYSKVQIATSAKQNPADVIFLSEEAPSFIVGPGYVMPLNDLIKNDKDIKSDDFARLDFWTMDGNTYGLTSYVQMVMMDYNADKLKKAGYDTAPKTWEELQKVAKELKAKGVDEYPISLGAIDWSWYLMSLSMGDPMFDKDLKPVFADPGSKSRAAMTMLLGFFKDKLITPAMLSETTPHAVYMGGTGTFHQGWQGSLGLLNSSEKSKQAPNVKYMVYPEVGNTWSLDAALGISTQSENKEAAWKFIKWYVGEANQRAIFDAFGLIPAQLSLQEALNKEGKITEFSVMQEQAKHINQLPRYAKWWGPWTTKVTEQLRLGIQGSLTADQVIDTVANDWNDLMAEYK